MLKGIYYILLVTLFMGCAHDRPEGKTEAEKLFKEAQDLYKDEKYLLATEKLNSIRSQHPYSFYATHAELMQADILFQQENYIEAAAAYQVFRDLHPKNERLDYVMWKVAESNYRQLPSTFDRDLSPAVEAIKYYEDLLNKYPNSSYISGANEKIQNCKTLLMKKEKYIADFYFKTEVYDAAIYRYDEIIRDFRDQEIKDHCAVRILQAAYKLKDIGKCKQYSVKYMSEVTHQAKAEMVKTTEKCLNVNKE